MIDNLEFSGRSLKWSFEGKTFQKVFAGNLFYADVLLSGASPQIFVIVARSRLEVRDAFYVVRADGEIDKQIQVPESVPKISSLYAVDKSETGYEIIARSNDIKSQRDMAIEFSADKREFISWREHM